MMTDDEITLRFAYQPWRGSCRAIYGPDHACRLPTGHKDDHAAGYGSDRVRWPQTSETEVRDI